MAADGWFATGMIRFARSRQNRPGRSAKAEGPRSRRRYGRAHSLHVEHPAQMGAAHQEPRRPSARSLSARDFRRDFQEALAALLGKDAPNLSAAVIARLKSEWEDEYRRWQKRDLSARHYVYVWADGVYLQARMEPQAECMLVLMGATAEGKKELIGFQTGMRESGQSWKELLVDLKARGLVVAPQVAIGDGALGFWKALDEAFPTTRHQRCWLHKTLNVLATLPKSVQPNAHKDLREIWLSPSRGAAEAAMTTFAEKYAPKYDKAVECLIKDQQTLLTFFDLPADHWDHVRTSSPIESVFATVSHRTVRMKGALSQDTASHGVQTGDGRVQDLAAIARSKPVAESRQRHKIQRRNRSCRRNQIRRLIHTVTDFSA